jgi:hypothetical protein
MRFSIALLTSVLSAAAVTGLSVRADTKDTLVDRALDGVEERHVEANSAVDVAARDAEANEKDHAAALEVRGSSCPVTWDDRLKYCENLYKQYIGQCGSGCEDSIASFQSKNSRCTSCAFSSSDMQKYLENLFKLATNNCGDGCQNSIASYESKQSRCSKW